MKKRRIWIRILVLTPLLLLAGVFVLLHLFADFSMSEEEVRAAFDQAGVPYDLKEKAGITYVETGNPEGQTVLFIHGSPGSWDNFISYLLDESLRETYRLISVNRLGFGGDSLGKPEPSLARHAEAALSVVEGDSPVILVGHSMGGPVAAKAAMLFPERVKGVVLLSAALDPELEKVMFIQRVGAFGPIAWLLPSSLDACNRELIPLEQELRDMQPGWQGLSIPLIAVHGDRDTLVPVENMDFLQQQVSSDILEVRILEGANHFIPWTREADVKQALLAL